MATNGGRRPAPTAGARDRSEDAGVVRKELSELRAAWGVQFPAVATLLRALAGDHPVSQETLTRESGLSHRSVAEVIGRLEPWLTGGQQGWRLGAEGRSAVQEELRHVSPAGPPGDALLDDITRLKSRAPSRRRELDHVLATPETCLRRARFLAQTYSLDGGHVLCLGDHDLTSLALSLVAPGAQISVVDIDDDLLSYVDRSAREIGQRVSCQFADLRLGLPPALRGAADLVFTDPPYTPEGVRLFAARAAQALRRNELSRLLLCYGYGDRQPTLGLKVQSELHALRLVYEAIHPRFNQYLGAQAIGSASALYVLRAAGQTWKALEREAAADARIYSHGEMSIEARPRPLAEELQRPVRERLADADGTAVLAGTGWSAGPGDEVVSLPALWRLYERHATSLPAHRPRMPDTAAVNLLDNPALTARILLVNRSRRLLLVAPGRDARRLLEPGATLANLFGAAYALAEVAGHAGATVVEAVRRSDGAGGEAGTAAEIARYLVQHPAATLANALRDAVVQVAEGWRPLTKNEARALVEAQEPITAARDLRLPDLPLHVLENVARLAPVLAASIQTG